MPIVGMGYGPFWKQRFTANDIPDLAGKTAVVTGGTAGIGLETSLQLASHGARVIMLSSTEARGQAAIREIKEKTGKDGKTPQSQHWFWSGPAYSDALPYYQQLALLPLSIHTITRISSRVDASEPLEYQRLGAGCTSTEGESQEH